MPHIEVNDKKLSQLDAATLPLAGDELAYVVQSGESLKTTVADIAACSLLTPAYFYSYAQSIAGLRIQPSGGPSPTAFTPGGSGTQEQYAFALNNTLPLPAIIIPGVIKQNANAYFHINWTTNGTQVRDAKFEIEYTICIGDGQAVFPAPSTISPIQTASGTAYKPMTAEYATPIVIAEPGTNLSWRIKRVTNGGTDITDTLFILSIELHIQADRIGSSAKSPPYY